MFEVLRFTRISFQVLKSDDYMKMIREKKKHLRDSNPPSSANQLSGLGGRRVIHYATEADVVELIY